MVYTKDNLREMQIFPPFQSVNPAYDQTGNRWQNAMPISSGDQSSSDYDYIDNGREPKNSSVKKDHSQLSILHNANPAYISSKGENALHCNNEEIHFQPSIKSKINPSYISIKQGSEKKGEEECFQLSTQHTMNPAYDHVSKAQVRGLENNNMIHDTVEVVLDGSIHEYFDNTGKPYETPLLINKDNFNCAHVDEEEND